MDGDKRYKSFQDLEVWKRSRALKMSIFELVIQFPNDERFALTDQLKRASRSIAAKLLKVTGDFLTKTNCIFAFRQEALYMNV